MQVHYGMVLPSGKVHPNATEPYGVPISEECAVWLHMVNLFTGRDDRSSGNYRTDRSWQWARAPDLLGLLFLSTVSL